MSMSINIDKVLKNTWGNYSPQKNNSTPKQANFDENIFAQASALVAEYKKEQEENKNSTSSSKKSSFGGLTFAQVAGMSTKDFLNYAYNNEAFSVDKQDSSGVDLPMFVRYKAQVVCTSGKSFMASFINLCTFLLVSPAVRLYTG